MRTHAGQILLLALAVAVPPAVVAQSATDVARANNPLAPITAINIHNYFMPTLYGIPDQGANATLLRPVLGTSKVIIRGTLPLSTVPSASGEGLSGLGDFSVFGAFLLSGSESKTQLGVGPLLVIPTATNDALGAGKWQAGGAFVVVSSVAPTVLVFGLVTYQQSFAGDETRSDASLFTVQPGAIIQVGGGYYLRTSGVWQFNTQTGDYSIPFGLGAGKVVRAGKAVLNLFLEPQFTILHDGAGQPAFQLFAGLNLQFPKQ
jgi:hypothetical protein